MAFNLRSNNRDQLLVLPPSVMEWMPARHLSHAVLKAVSSFDLEEFRSSLRADGKGGASYDPEMMTALVLYAFCTGTFSSRRIEKRCEEDVAYRMISANSLPDHATIARFLKGHEEHLAGLFDQVLSLCVKANLVDVSVLAVDGTKMSANASREKFFDTEEIARRALRQIIENDDDEDACFGERRGDEVPDELHDPEWITRALKEIADEREASKQSRPDRKLSDPKINTTDPDCRMMKTRNGIRPSYNSQAVATGDQVIVAADVTQESADSHQLGPMSNQAKGNLEQLGLKLGALVGDAGYWDPGHVANSAAPNTIVSLRPDLEGSSERTLKQIRQIFDDADAKNISQLEAARRLGIERHVFRNQFKLYQKDPNAGLAIYLMRDRLADPVNQELTRRRKTIIEPIFGQIKFNRGFNRFRRRGINAVKCEWKLMCATHNLLKWSRATDYGFNLLPS